MKKIISKYRFALLLIAFSTVGIFCYTAGERHAIAGTLTASSGPLHFSKPIVDPHTALVIQHAKEDFAAVAAGLSPIHAVTDGSVPLPADGGTSFFKAPGYSLTVVKSLASVGELDGYIYGPHISFDESILIGNTSSVSQLSFYSRHELEKLLGML